MGFWSDSELLDSLLCLWTSHSHGQIDARQGNMWARVIPDGGKGRGETVSVLCWGDAGGGGEGLSRWEAKEALASIGDTEYLLKSGVILALHLPWACGDSASLSPPSTVHP